LHFTDPEDDPALAACPQLRQVSELTLTAAHLSYPLLRSPHLQRLRSLRLFHIERLVATDLNEILAIPDLERLELHYCNHSRVQRVPAGSLSRLRDLSLTGWAGQMPWTTIVGRLERLALRHAGTEGRNMLQSLGPMQRLGPLRELTLESMYSYPMPDIGGLLAIGVLADLHSLTLRDCSLGAADVEALSSAGGPRRLIHLDLGCNLLGQAGVDALLQSRHLTQLAYRGLSRICLPWSVLALVRSLCASPLSRLAALDLCGNNMTAEAALELAVSPLGQRIYWLDLRGTQLSDKGAQALLVGDWPRLARLDLRDNPLSAAKKMALRRRFGDTVYY
jgi:hypothetical protein